MPLNAASTGAENPTVVPDLRLRGRVLDARLLTPLAARVWTEGGESVFSRFDDGEFELSIGAPRACTLVASVPGYSSGRVELSIEQIQEPVEVLLQPLSEACVRVEFDDGRPAVGARVEWRAAVEALELDELTDWIDTRRRSAGAVIESETDAAGHACVATGVPLFASVTDRASGVGCTVRVPPWGEQRVVLSTNPLRVQFVDIDTRQPLAGLELDAWWPREIEAAAHALKTDASGVAVLSAATYPVLLRSPNSSLWQSTLVPLSPGAVQAGIGGRMVPMVRIDERPSGILTVGVQYCGGLVRCVDAVTGEPIDAAVRTTVRSSGECPTPSSQVTKCTVKTARCALQAADQVFMVKRGDMRLHCLLPSTDGLQAAAAGSMEVVFAVAGYRPHAVSLRELPGRSDLEPLELRLTPSASRTVKIVYASGEPYARTVAILSPDFDYLAWQDTHRGRGVHGPFDWLGGDLLVRIGDSWVNARRIQASQLQTESEIALTVDSPTGAIVVEGCPAHLMHVPLVAKEGVSLLGTVYGTTSVVGTTRRFDRLPAGTYMVGPRAWVENAEMNSFTIEDKFVRREHSTRIAVGNGETVVVPWLDPWCGTVELRGRVRVLPTGAATPFLTPAHGPYSEERPSGIQRLVFGRRTPRIPMDPSGNYVIAAGMPQPLALVVCVADDGPWGTVGGLHVLDSLWPGESLDIATGSIELHWTGQVTDSVVPVVVTVRAEDMHAPVSTAHNSRKFSWSVEQPLRIDGIPLHVRSLEVKGRVAPIQLETGGVIRLEIDYGTLSPVQR